MLQIAGDLFAIECDAICIPTNGEVDSKGNAIMGAGLALKAKGLWPWLPRVLGECLTTKGNHVFYFTVCEICSYPTKDRWRQGADIGLIKRSAEELVQIAFDYEWREVALPRVGCGCGGLKWKDVKAALSPIFDDRFNIVTPLNPLELGSYTDAT